MATGSISNHHQFISKQHQPFALKNKNHVIIIAIILGIATPHIFDIYPILGSLLGVETSTGDDTDPYCSFNNNYFGDRSLLLQCKRCKRFYKSAQKLQEHIRKYCLKEKKYKCISCEYRSRRKDHVLRHAKRKHPEAFLATLNLPASTTVVLSSTGEVARFYEISNEESTHLPDDVVSDDDDDEYDDEEMGSAVTCLVDPYETALP